MLFYISSCWYIYTVSFLDQHLLSLHAIYSSLLFTQATVLLILLQFFEISSHYFCNQIVCHSISLSGLLLIQPYLVFTIGLCVWTFAPGLLLSLLLLFGALPYVLTVFTCLCWYTGHVLISPFTTFVIIIHSSFQRVKFQTLE